MWNLATHHQDFVRRSRLEKLKKICLVLNASGFSNKSLGFALLKLWRLLNRELSIWSDNDSANMARKPRKHDNVHCRERSGNDADSIVHWCRNRHLDLHFTGSLPIKKSGNEETFTRNRKLTLREIEKKLKKKFSEIFLILISFGIRWVPQSVQVFSWDDQITSPYICLSLETELLVAWISHLSAHPSTKTTLIKIEKLCNYCVSECVYNLYNAVLAEKNILQSVRIFEQLQWILSTRSYQREIAAITVRHLFWKVKKNSLGFSSSIL